MEKEDFVSEHKSDEQLTSTKVFLGTITKFWDGICILLTVVKSTLISCSELLGSLQAC